MRSFIDQALFINQRLMKLKALFEVAVKLLSLKNDNHSITEAICRHHLFDTNSDPSLLAQALQEAVGNQNISPNFVDWFNTLLFNVCSVNQQLIVHYENKMLESTGDAPKYMQKDGKMVASSVEVASHIRNILKKWLQRVVGLPFIQRILMEVNQKSITKSKSLRSFLQTLDYISYKYQITIPQKQQFSTMLASIDRKNQAALMLERASWTNKKLFSGAEHLVAFLNEVADNYTINLVSVATIISANYFHSNPIRKPFESAVNCGQVIVEEMADFLIRKCTKNDIFSERMDSYRPFELFMEAIFQKFSSVLLQFNEIITSLMMNGQVSLYHAQNHKKIQAMATLFSYQIQIAYPRLHHLLRYIHSSLLAKYTQVESLQLMKKFILNRFLLNPFYFALLNSPSQQEMQRYVRVANEARILFYQKKMDSIPQEYKSARLSQHAELLRKSLFSMLNAKETGTMDEQARCDKGVYINDTLLGALYFEVSDSLKGMKQVKSNNSELHSQSSLSFSLRNDSASRMQMPTQQNLPISGNNSSIPHLPKPRSVREESSQRNTSKIISTDANLQQRETPVDHLTELVNLRRQYGQLKDEIELRSHHRAQKRNNWKRQLQLLHQPVSTVISDLSRNSSQLMIHSLLL